jgi:hypothetical protein
MVMRQLILHLVLETSIEKSISLSTPITHISQMPNFIQK